LKMSRKLRENGKYYGPVSLSSKVEVDTAFFMSKPNCLRRHEK
jgi:hypothetical protein